MTESVEKQVLKSIYNHKRGKIFFPVNFSKFGSSTAVRQALNRLEDKGILLRLARGIYPIVEVSRLRCNTLIPIYLLIICLMINVYTIIGLSEHF